MQTDTGKLALIASKYVNSTNRHIFLTGRAGTGKTTFLRTIVGKTHKKCVVAAPTGIAAINAGGVTLHSLLQLPFGCFIPAEIPPGKFEITTEINTPKSIMRQRRFNRNKLAMLREMELLIIDEVSMLRADLLDAIDAMLRSVRRQRNVPFGGVQMLFIGDLLQLPPVVKDNEWQYLSPFYKSAFFFEAHALKGHPPVYIELDKIYRQTEQEFIELLGRFRDNRPERADLERLNQAWISDYQSKIDEGYIFITTHNYKADEKNRNALNQLSGKTFTYEAIVENDFPENNFPLEEKLVIKQGARVMFVKNDHTGEGRYFNGKIGTVSFLDDEEIRVAFDDGSDEVLLERYTWENKRYTLDEETGEIREKIIGTFSHYPVKLAWAVTVHKSQGLTFDKAVLDLSGAFAPGQVYVALSRLRSLQGLALSSKLTPNSLDVDEVVSRYAENKNPLEKLEANLENEKIKFVGEEVRRAFDFDPIKRELSWHYKSYDKDEGKSIKQKHKMWAGTLLKDIDEPIEVTRKFQDQVNRVLQSDTPDLSYLLERVTAAKNYFEPVLKGFSKRVVDHVRSLEGSKKVKAYIGELKDIENLFFRQLYFIYKSEAILKSTLEETELSREKMKQSELYKGRKEMIIETDKSTGKRKTREKKPPKPKTNDITFKLYREGKTIPEIAKERGLTTGTIETHFLPFLKTGKVKITDLIPEKKAKTILECIREIEAESVSQVKHVLGEDYSWGEIRMVWAGIEAES